MLNEYDIKNAWKKLKDGNTLNRVARFYGITEEELEQTLKKYYNICGKETINKRIKASKKNVKEVNYLLAIRIANNYKKNGIRYEEFLKIMEKSGKKFPKVITNEIRNIFNSESEVKDVNSNNDEIEI
ncbi:MAG TPA: hypothetical protein DCZ30_03145 [Clostridiales bacterium]|nr:hypothetical protein [Clostridiales bacterium]